MKMPHNFDDKTGKRYGMLLVIGFSGKNKHGQTLWLTKCDCGKEKIALGGGMVCGHTRSCGCLKISTSKTSRRTHGYCSGGKTDEYKIWLGMKKRCVNKNAKSYEHYGGRGIKVCRRWMKFENFLEDVGLRPSKNHSLDRFPNKNGNYEPGNVRWATQKQQCGNKRTNLVIEFRGETMTAGEWADKLGIKRFTLYCRLNGYGWSIERALTTPVKVKS